eukprot:365123-Chlamydomonas_euryale.AAC.4
MMHAKLKIELELKLDTGACEQGAISWAMALLPSGNLSRRIVCGLPNACQSQWFGGASLPTIQC